MRIVFRPNTNSIEDILDTAHARKLWKAGKGNIIAALEQVSGLKFRQATIQAVSGTIEAMHSGWPGIKPMSLPLKYHVEGSEAPHYHSELEYVGLVSHELAHHLLLEHDIVAPQGSDHDLQAHQHIYLFLADAWRLAYNSQKAKRLITNEPSYVRHHYITRSFHWAERLGKVRRQQIMAELVAAKALPVESQLHTRMPRSGSGKAIISS